MNRIRNYLFAIAITASLAAFAPMSHASNHNNADIYPLAVVKKTARGIANIAFSPLEIPKSMINTFNDSHFLYSVIAGVPKGLLQMVCRIGTGVLDLATFPLPTKPIAQPEYIWDDFDANTTYGEAFRLEELKDIDW